MKTTFWFVALAFVMTVRTTKLSFWLMFLSFCCLCSLVLNCCWFLVLPVLTYRILLTSLLARSYWRSSSLLLRRKWEGNYQGGWPCYVPFSILLGFWSCTWCVLQAYGLGLALPTKPLTTTLLACICCKIWIMNNVYPLRGRVVTCSFLPSANLGVVADSNIQCGASSSDLSGLAC